MLSITILGISCIFWLVEYEAFSFNVKFLLQSKLFKDNTSALDYSPESFGRIYVLLFKVSTTRLKYGSRGSVNYGLFIVC